MTRSSKNICLVKHGKWIDLVEITLWYHFGKNDNWVNSLGPRLTSNTIHALRKSTIFFPRNITHFWAILYDGDNEMISACHFDTVITILFCDDSLLCHNVTCLSYSANSIKKITVLHPIFRWTCYIHKGTTVLTSGQITENKIDMFIVYFLNCGRGCNTGSLLFKINESLTITAQWVICWTSRLTYLRQSNTMDFKNLFREWICPIRCYLCSGFCIDERYAYYQINLTLQQDVAGLLLCKFGCGTTNVGQYTCLCNICKNRDDSDSLA